MSIIHKRKNILFLYSALRAYFFDCLRILANEIEYNISVIETAHNKNYPVTFTDKQLRIVNFTNVHQILKFISLNDIALVFVSGWRNKTIIDTAKILRRNNIPIIILSDQADKNNIRQFFGRFYISNYLQMFSHAVVPGKVSAQLLIKYGFNRENISFGLYTANNLAFNRSSRTRLGKLQWPRIFLYDGQYIKRKGFDYLISEYKIYQHYSITPWKLITIGSGPLHNIIPPNIMNLGFVNPYEVPKIYAKAGCFILPSLDDHWPLVIHQATCAGLPLIISHKCGNAIDLFEENRNGYSINRNTRGLLATKMLKIEKSSVIKQMSNISYSLSKKYSISKWIYLFIRLIDSYAC